MLGSAAVDAVREVLLDLRQLRLDRGVEEGAEVDVLGGGAVAALTLAMAADHVSEGIRVNAVAPGGTDAPPRRIPRNAAQPTEQEKAWYRQIVDQTISSSLMKRYGTTEEQAAVILFLASDEASYVTGVTLAVAGGDLG